MALTLTAVACSDTRDTTATSGAPAATSTSETPGLDSTIGICSLISRATLEQVYGSIKVIRNDQGPITGNAVHGSCDYLKDESHPYRVFFTINVNSDPNQQAFVNLSTQPSSRKVPTTGAEVFAVEGGMLHLVAHKNSITIEVGLRVGSDVANGPRDNAVALELLEQALSHF